MLFAGMGLPGQPGRSVRSAKTIGCQRQTGYGNGQPFRRDGPANARLGAVHGMANPIGGMSHAPHGAVCARLLPLVMETNLQALHTRQPDSAYHCTVRRDCPLLTGDEKANAEAGPIWIKELCLTLDIRSLERVWIESAGFPNACGASAKSQQHEGQPDIPDRHRTNEHS